MDQISEMQYKSTKPRDVCIVGVARTPMGGLLGSLSTLSATKLGSIAIECALKRARVDPSLVQEVFFGNVLSANLGQAPARQAALGAGIPNSVICTTINKVCSSGMKATMLAAQSIHLGVNDVVVAGGMESMSNAPKYLAMARTGSRLGHDTIIDGMLKDGLWDVYNDFGMGICAEICADNYRFSREEQDSFAIRSYERGIAAKNSGAFSWEIAPARFDSVLDAYLNQKIFFVKISGNRGRQTTIIDKDDGLEKFDPAKLKKLPPSFKKNGGSVTAGNSSLIRDLRLSELATNSDGAAALVLVSGEMAKKLGLQVIARIKGFADAAQVVALANQKLLGLDPENVNVHGGAVSLGHPLGCSGARILVTLLGVLRQKRGRYGVAGICNGGGGASALVLELISTSGSVHSRL
uniref:Acetyl-CoA C-acetyltransferase n=1 Tax=Chenopodium quinoa TaxID=63459 RepID=A0A803LQ88_CHEQI